MCVDCWDYYARPVIDTPAVRAAAAAVDAVYVHHSTGGNLHVVLDDWNIEDVHLAACLEQIEGGGYRRPEAHAKVLGPDEADSPEQLAAERTCHDLFAALTEHERASALALHRKFWGGLRGKA